MTAGSQPFVRAADPADAGQVAAVFAHYVATSMATFEEVAPAGGDAAICGFAYASPWRPKPAYRYTVEDTVYLSPGCTGRGLGTALLGALLAGCEAAGARQVIAVIADTGCDASAALHRRLGFAEVGKLPQVGFKFGRRVDTALMQKDLGPNGVGR